jgi:hypothetical protein
MCSGCNRIYDEYYVVNSTSFGTLLSSTRILCAKCWDREMDEMQYQLRECNRVTQQMGMEFHKMQQQHNIRYNDISNQIKHLEEEIRIKESSSEWRNYYSEDGGPKPYNYEDVLILRNRMWNLKKEEENRYRTRPFSPKPPNRAEFENRITQLKKAKYYSPAEAKAKEQAEQQRLKEETRKQKEQEQKTIAEAENLLQKAKQQTQNKILQKVKDKIAEIELLVQKKTSSDSLVAIGLLKKQYDWKLNTKETFKACLINFDKEKKSFETKREMNILQARAELAITKQSITKDIIGQTTSVIANIESLVNKETNVDAEEASKLLKQVYTWKMGSGRTFTASLPDFDSKYIQCKEIEKQEKKRKQEADKLAEQRRQEMKKKRETAERIQREKDAIAAKKVFWTIFVIALIIGVIFLIATYWQVILAVLVIGGVIAALLNN